ncbi:MAG TPA: glycosyltransferase [Candidatus Paceibacterota bacterium]
MEKKIIAIGQCTDQIRNLFSGQAMMFESLTDYLKENSYSVDVVNLTSKYTNIQVGEIVVKRIIEYITIILKSIPFFYRNKGGILYITTAQTKGGFLRDFIFIHLAFIFRCKILIQQFGSNFEIFYNCLSPFFKYLVRKTFNKGNYIIVEGVVTKKQFSFIKNYENKVLTLTNGLPEKAIKKGSDVKIFLSNESFKMIYLSYMIESKGYWDVLEAVNILINEFGRNVECVFAGMFKSSVDDEIFKSEVDASNQFHNFIYNKKLDKIVTYYEGLMGAKKSEAFLKSHVFLLPSYFKFEGQPVSVLEAMAYGCVPIVTQYRMIPDMVTHETGIYVEKKSPRQIADKIMYLMDNPEIYKGYSKASIDRFTENFTFDKYCSKFCQILNKL